MLTPQFLKILTLSGTPLVIIPVDTFILVPLSSWYSSSWLLHGEHSRFNGFHKQRTEAPIELDISIFTDPLVDYLQYYIQYLHAEARHLICYGLFPWLHLSWLNFTCCVCTLLPNAVTVIHIQTTLCLVRLFYAVSTGLFAVSWCYISICIHFNISHNAAS